MHLQLIDTALLSATLLILAAASGAVGYLLGRLKALQAYDQGYQNGFAAYAVALKVATTASEKKVLP